MRELFCDRNTFLVTTSKATRTVFCFVSEQELVGRQRVIFCALVIIAAIAPCTLYPCWHRIRSLLLTTNVSDEPSIDSESMDTEIPSEWLVTWRKLGFKFEESNPYFCSRNAIEESARKGDVEALRYIQKEIPNVYACLSSYKESVLYIAAQEGHVAFADYVLNNGGKHLLDVAQKHGKTPLWAAIFRSKSVTIVKLLLLHGASLTAPSRSPLAELRGATDVVHFLRPLRNWLIKMQSRPIAEHPMPLCEKGSPGRSWLTNQVRKRQTQTHCAGGRFFDLTRS